MNDIKKKILHLDDDIDLHAYVETLLEDVAHVTSVPSAKEYEKSLAADTFDLFLLDLVFKDGSGSKMTKKLKQLYPGTPIVILSAHDVTGAIDGTAASFIKGKFKTEDFIQTIKKLMG